MAARYSSHVKCARCRQLTARENAREAGGLLYGPCCINRALADAAWTCAGCGGLFCEEDMINAWRCKFCAAAVLLLMAIRIPERYDAELITDQGEFENLIDRLVDEAKPVGYDIETSYDGEPRADAQKHPEENFICGFSLTNSLKWARAVPLAFESGPNLVPHQVAKPLRYLAEARDAQGRPLLVAHNAVFELRCTARWFSTFLDMPLEDAYFEVRSDTMVEAYIEAEHESYALKSLTWETFGHRMTEIMELFETAGGKKLTKFQQDSIQFHLLDPADPKVAGYMCDDALWALAHHLKRYPLVTDPAFRGAFLYKVDMGQLPVICAMSDTGIAYDWNMMREAAQRGQAFMGRLAAEINADLAAGIGKPVSLNLASPPQIARVLYDKTDGLGLPVRRRSKKTKNPSTDANALKALKDAHPVVRKIQSYRAIKRRCVDNYAGKYEDDYNYAPDGRAHPNILYTAVTTGRFAFSRPAAQQPPKTKTWTLASGETFTFPWRDFITVPPPGALGDTEQVGWYILGFDLSQCLVPETRVCTADLRWVPIGSVQPGDELIGFDEFAGDYKGPGRRARLKPAVVEHTRRLVKDCYRVKLSDGREVISAANHMWVEVGTSSGSTLESGDAWRGSTYIPKPLRKWKRTDELVPGQSRLCHWVHPWAELSAADQYEAGWLAGFADGEGWIFGNHGRGSGSALYVGLAQNPGPVWERVDQACKRLGYSLSKVYRHREGSAAALSGNRVEKRYLDYESSVRFLGQCRPVRLGEQSRRFWDGRQTYTQSSASVEVVEVEHLGRREVVAVQTSARTYIAEGLLSHNCELRAMAGEAGEPALLEAYRNGVDVHKLTASKMLGIPLEQVTKEQRDIYGKIPNLALQYQMSAPSLAEFMGAPKEEGQRLYDAWFAGYPHVKAWTEATVAAAVRDGYTLSRYGRKHPIWEFAKTCEFCAQRGISSKWTDRRTRCPRCDHLGTPRSEAVIAKGMRLAGNAPIQGAATGDVMRIIQIRADKALRTSGLRDRVHLFLNVHDSLDFYVRKDVPPGEVIRVLQPAVVFPVPGWPEIVADWHAGLRMGSLAELEVGPDFSARRKGVKQESPVSVDEDGEDGPELPAVDLSAVKAMALKTVTSKAEVPDAVVPDVPEVVVAAGPGGLADPGDLGSGDGVHDMAGRTVIITVPDVPDKAAAAQLKAVAARLPGLNTVILRTQEYGDIALPGTCGLTPGHRADVAFILPGAEVTYDGASVDYAAIADGIAVLQAWSSQSDSGRG